MVKTEYKRDFFESIPTDELKRVVLMLYHIQLIHDSCIFNLLSELSWTKKIHAFSSITMLRAHNLQILALLFDNNHSLDDTFLDTCNSGRPDQHLYLNITDFYKNII